MVTVLGVAAALVLADLAVHALFARLILGPFEQSAARRRTPPELAPAVRPLLARTPDGLDLRVDWLPAPVPARGALVFCPEFGGDRSSAAVAITAAHDAGFDVVAFDFRGQGDSPAPRGHRPLHWLTEGELTDLHAVLDFVAGQPHWASLPTVLMGLSRGGCAALAVAAERPEISGVVADGAFSTEDTALAHVRRHITRHRPIIRLVPRWHVRWTVRLAIWWSGKRRGCRYVDCTRGLRRLANRRLLLISGACDDWVAAGSAHRLCRRAGHPDDAVWLIPGARHNSTRQVDPAAYDAGLRRFLEAVAAGAAAASRMNGSAPSPAEGEPSPAWSRAARARRAA